MKKLYKPCEVRQCSAVLTLDVKEVLCQHGGALVNGLA